MSNKKYHSQEQKKRSTLQGIHFLLTLSQLTSADSDPQALKASVAALLEQHEGLLATQKLISAKRCPLEHYSIHAERHKDGEWHLHIYLKYIKLKELTLAKAFSYLPKHPNIQRVRNLKQALTYIGKDDLNATKSVGFNPLRAIQTKLVQQSPYQLLRAQMLKDPFHFEPITYLREHDLDVAASKGNWPKALNLLKRTQEQYCNHLLKTKPGFKYITRQLIQQQLSLAQLRTYDSWSGYQTIVNYLNQLPTLSFRRSLKTLNLLITGEPSIGKSALFQADLVSSHNCVERYFAVYPMGTKTWWPDYKPQVYPLILWNQAKLTSYSYDTILKVLDGTKVDLPYKGGSTLKYDNPLVIMLSNRSLPQLITDKFPNSLLDRQMATKNLAVRIHNVIVPKGYNLFLLQKLLVPA